MTKEQEDIKYLKESVCVYKNTIPKISEAIETVLNMLKENSAEIHQKNTELAEKNAEIEKYKRKNKELSNQLLKIYKEQDNYNSIVEKKNEQIQKKDQMIDLMADEIGKLITCPLEDYNCDLDCENKCKNQYKDCWKQYFERKAEQSSSINKTQEKN